MKDGRQAVRYASQSIASSRDLAADPLIAARGLT